MVQFKVCKLCGALVAFPLQRQHIDTLHATSVARLEPDKVFNSLVLHLED
jgi:hypothetical protein